MMNTYIVYCRTNIITGKQYIGLTSMSLEERAGKDGSRYCNCQYLWNAIQKYGWNNFASCVLACELTHRQACELERYYIKLFNTQAPNGYNLTDGGDAGFKHTEEVKQIISNKLRGNKSRTGYHNSEAMNHRMSQIMRGNTYGQYKGKPVVQYTMDGEFVAEYKSSADASRITGVCNVKHAVAGRLKTAGGFIWKRKGL